MTPRAFRPFVLHALLGTLLSLVPQLAAAGRAPVAVTPVRRLPARPAAPAALRVPSGLERDTLAWAGESAITALDLVQRIEWMPWLEKRGASTLDSAKARALESLVAEALLAQESRREAPGDSLTPMRAALERALMRDALYQQVVDSVPVPTAERVARLVRTRYPGAPAAELPGLRHTVRDSLVAMASALRAGEFMMQQLAGMRVQVDSSTFTLLADSLRAFMVLANEPRNPGVGYRVPAEAPDALTRMLAASLGRTLARMPGEPLTLRGALEDMRFYPFVMRSLEPAAFASELSRCLRHIVEGEAMAREGARRHLDRLPAVQHDLRLWTVAWRAEHVLYRLGQDANASDEETIRSLALYDPEDARELCDVDLSEILCGTRAEATEIAGEIALGARFDSLATRRSRRSEWAVRGGRSGWFPVHDRPELGALALLSLPDSLAGPYRLAEGFSLIRVHGKRMNPDSVRDIPLFERARARATGEKRLHAIATHVAELANHTDVRMDLAALKRVEILESNMVVKRTLGFGGGMTAAPSLAPMWHWVPQWRGRAAPLP